MHSGAKSAPWKHQLRLTTNCNTNADAFTCCRAQTFKKMIGEGSIGRVHLGRWQETDVAIKVLTSLSNIAVGMASASPTPRAGGDASAKTDRGVAYGDDAQATKRTLEREARPPVPWTRLNFADTAVPEPCLPYTLLLHAKACRSYRVTMECKCRHPAKPEA